MVKFEMSDFRRKAYLLGVAADQVPYATALTLNDAMFETRVEEIFMAWPGGVTVRNQSFMRAALRVDKASKGNLSASIFDVLGRASLDLHADGGTKTPDSGKLAVPVDPRIRRGARGVPKSQRPRTFSSRRNARVTAKGIFLGEAGRLHMIYRFLSSADIDKRFPFYETFEENVVKVVEERLPERLYQAMATRR